MKYAGSEKQYKSKRHFLQHLCLKSCAPAASPSLADQRKAPITESPGKILKHLRSQSCAPATSSPASPALDGKRKELKTKALDFRRASKCCFMANNYIICI